MRVLYVIRILNSKISFDLFTFPLLVLLVLRKFSQVKLAPDEGLEPALDVNYRYT